MGIETFSAFINRNSEMVYPKIHHFYRQDSTIYKVLSNYPSGFRFQ